jgi:predicted dehydrogenase
MARFRFIVLGTGFFSRKWIETIKASTDSEVVGIASRSRSVAEGVQRDLDLPGATLYAGWEEAVDRSKSDAVIITLPQSLHPEATARALRAGLHVLCEKPLAVDGAGARAVLEETRRHPDRVVMVNQNFRWRPHIQCLRRGIREGLIGRIGHVMFECRQQIRRKTVDAWREKMPEPYLLDFAIHHFDLIRYLTGDEVARVIGLSFRPPWSWFEGNSAATAILTLRAGAVVDYGGTMVSLGSETPQEGLITVIGEGGTLVLDEASRITLHSQGDTRTLSQEPIPGGELGYGLSEFLAAVREGRPPETHVAEHIRSLAISLAVVESSKQGRWVEVAGQL